MDERADDSTGLRGARSRRRWWLLGAALAIAIVAAVAVFALSRRTGGGDAAAAPPATTVPVETSRPANNGLKAVVLGGGGVTGFAWEIGLLAGLNDLGIDLSAADLFVGTSAGSAVSAQITTGIPIATLYRDIGITSSQSTVFSGLAPGAIISEADWMKVESGFFGPIEWPKRPLKIAVVGANDRKVRFFSGADGVPLIAALAASSAIPGIIAPITVGSEQYVDGGVAGNNIDGAAGYRLVVAILPIPRPGPTAVEVAAVRSAGGDVLQITPDAQSMAVMGTNRLDVTSQRIVAEAGYRQATTEAAALRAFWQR